MKKINKLLIKISNNSVKILLISILLFLSFGIKGQKEITDTIIIQRPDGPGQEYRADTFKLPLYFSTTKNIKPEINSKFELEEWRNGKKCNTAPKYIDNSFSGAGVKEQGQSKDIVLILVEVSRTMDEDVLSKIKTGISSFVENYQGTVYLSTYGTYISAAKRIDKGSGEGIGEILRQSSNLSGTLYNSIWIKLREMSGETSVIKLFEPNYIPNQEFIDRCKKSVYLHLLIITDGKNDVSRIERYNSLDSSAHAIPREILLKYITKINENIKIFCFGYEKNTDESDSDFLIKISKHRDNSSGYKSFNAEQIKERFEQFRLDISHSFMAIFQCKPNQVYTGETDSFVLRIIEQSASGKVFAGSTPFCWGSPQRPVSTSPEPRLLNLLWGFVYAFIIILVVFIIIQLLIPLIRNKIFDYKYVIAYKSAPNTLKKKCMFCGQDIYEREKIVIKCKHIIHQACWDDNNHMCPEFGQNCNEGKQDYFDVSDPFSKKNQKNYLSWVIYGLTGGFIVWTIFLVTQIKYSGLIRGLIKMIHSEMFLNMQGEQYVTKISSYFTIGILMGFFLTILFIYSEEYRKKNIKVVLRILLRGFIGAIIGFIAFLMGGVIIIIIGPDNINFWTAWIPWLIFGGTLGFSLSVKTTIHWKHGLFGGMLSIIFGVFLLYMLNNKGGLGLLYALMLYGGGLGLSVATIRAAADQYFLKVLNGPKEGSNIAIYKWLGSHGALNHIYMGRSNSCEISINWEKENNIAEKHVKIYINKNRNIPVIVSVEKGMSTTYNGRIDMITGREYELLNGVIFKIGDTSYQYIER